MRLPVNAAIPAGHGCMLRGQVALTRGETRWTSTHKRNWCGRAMAGSPKRQAARAAARRRHPAAARPPIPTANRARWAIRMPSSRPCRRAPISALAAATRRRLPRCKPGETVIDLGSGAGFDCFLAAGQVGETGHVIGVDMTHEMLKKARENAAKIGAPQCRIPPRRARASAGRRQHGRCDPLELRDQSGAGQGAGVPRGFPGAEAGRAAGDLRCRQQGAVARPS